MSNKPVNHARAAEHFLEDAPHLQFHDERLWDMRQKRDGQMHMLPEWQDLREEASRIKEHTLSCLPEYLEQFEENAKRMAFTSTGRAMGRNITASWARS